MARKSSVIKVTLKGDNSDLKRVLGDSESRVSKFSSIAGKGLKLAGAGAVGLAAGAVFAAPKVLELGGQLETMGVKASTVFGDSLSDIEAWSKATAGSLGLTSAELTGAAANFGDLLKPMGFTSEQAAEQAETMLDLSGALSAWSQGQYDAAEVSEILSKAMLGEREQLKALGISITEADVQARLAAKGQKELEGEALAMAKAVATQELILEKSTDAQAAWADGSMDAVKAQNESEASMRELRDTLVRAVYPALKAAMPIVQRVAEWVGERLPGAIETAQRWGRRLADWWQRTWPKVRPVVERVIDAVVAAFTLVKNWVDTNWPAIQDTIVGVVEAIRNVIETVSAGIAVIWEKYGDQIRDYTMAVWETIKSVVGGAIRAVKGVIDAVTALLRGDWSAFWDGLKNIVAGVWEAISGIVSGAIDGVKATLSAAWETIKTVASGAWDSLKTGIADAVGAIVSSVGSLPGEFLGMLSSFFDAAKSIGRRIVGGVTSGLANLGERITAPFRNALNKVIGWWNGLSFTLPTINLPKVETPFGTIGGGSFGGQTFSTPNLPTFHDGGFVGDRNGPPLDIPIMAQQGELVLSRAQVADLEAGGTGGGRVMVIDRREAPDWFNPDVDAHIRRIVRDEVAA